MLDNTFELVFFVGFIFGSIIRVIGTKGERQRQKKSGEKPKKDWLLLLPFLGMVLIPFVYLFSPLFSFADYTIPVWISVIGTIVFATALWMLWRSHADLGEGWSHTVEFKTGQVLVTNGVYRLIRHPMYCAHWLWALAQAMLLNNWFAGFSFALLFTPMYLIRISVEEKEMLKHFGSDYQDYMKRTGRVIPRVLTSYSKKT